jgi:HEAT repeat protein
MSIFIFIAIALALAWWFSGMRAGSRNERLYLRRRGYQQPEQPEQREPKPKDAYLFGLIESLGDLSPFSRERAAQELTRMCDSGKRDARMMGALVATLNDTDASVRRAAAGALASLGDAEALEPLQKRAEIEASAPVRVALQRAIEKLNGTKGDSEETPG